MDLLNFNFPFNAYELTQAIDILPNLYGRLNASTLFTPMGSRSRAVRIDKREHYIRVLPVEDGDDKPTAGIEPDQTAVFMEIPRIPHQEYIKPEDIQDWIAFSTDPLRPKTLEDSTNDKLQSIRDHYGITWEWMKLGALKGLITDGMGKTVYNLFDVFNITKKTINFELNVAATDVKAKTYEVARWMEEHAFGEPVSGVEAQVSPEFFDALTGHPNVEKFYVNWTGSAAFSGDMRKRFTFGAMTFSEYNGVLPMTDGTSARLITASKGQAYPVGTRNMFRHYNGPAKRLSLANMPGPDIYVSPKVLDHDLGLEFDCESNPLPICTRPDLLVELLQE